MNERKSLDTNQHFETHGLASMRLSALSQFRCLCSKIRCCLMRLNVLPPVLYNAKNLCDVKCSDGVGIFTFLVSGDYESGTACEQDLALALDTLTITRMCQKEDVKELFRLMKQVEDLKCAEKNNTRRQSCQDTK